MSNKFQNACRHLVRVRSCGPHPSAFVDHAAIRRDGSGHVPVALFRCPFPVSENCDRRLSRSHSPGITKLSKPVHPDLHPFFPKTHRPFHFDDFFERIYRFYIPLLERNDYNIHRQNEIDKYVVPPRSSVLSIVMRFYSCLSIWQEILCADQGAAVTFTSHFFRKEYSLCPGIQKSQNS